jgi:hypothetical protein
LFRILKWLVLGCGAALLILLALGTGFYFKDYRPYFQQKKGSLVNSSAEELARTELTRTYAIKLESTEGFIVDARLRIPLKTEGLLPAVLVVPGIETGHLAIRMLDERPAVIVMAIRYPYSGEPDFSGGKAISTLLEMRETGMKTIPSLLLALHYLRQLPDVDTNDIAVATVSFGTFLGVPAAALHPDVKRLIIVQGGGDIASIVAANAERLGMPFAPRVAGWIAQFALSPFEPNRYIGGVSPRPILMVNSPGDLLFPDESARSLYEHAGEPKEIVWHKSTHVMPGARDIIQELTKIVADKIYAKQLPRD